MCCHTRILVLVCSVVIFIFLITCSRHLINKKKYNDAFADMRYLLTIPSQRSDYADPSYRHKIDFARLGRFTAKTKEWSNGIVYFTGNRAIGVKIPSGITFNVPQSFWRTITNQNLISLCMYSHSNVWVRINKSELMNSLTGVRITPSLISQDAQYGAGWLTDFWTNKHDAGFLISTESSNGCISVFLPDSTKGVVGVEYNAL